MMDFIIIIFNLIVSISLLYAENPNNIYNSQCGQDKYINENIFKNKTSGIFIDIGAHDGKKYSNTLFFEENLNWNGICVEPQPDIFEELKKNRNCILVNACVSSKSGSEKFIWVHNGGTPGEYTEMLSGILSTYDPKHLERMEKELELYGGSYEIIDVPTITFNELLEKNNIYQIDYLSIDTEGSEFEILESINFDKFSIKVIDVENNYSSPEIKNFLISKNFKHIINIGGDEIYINKNLN